MSGAPIVVVDPSTVFHIDRDKLITFTHDPNELARLSGQIVLYKTLHESYGADLLKGVGRLVDSVVSGKEQSAHMKSTVAMDGTRLNTVGWAAGMPRTQFATDYSYDRVYSSANYEVGMVDGKAVASEIERITKIALEQWLGSVFITNELPYEVSLQCVYDDGKLFLAYETVRFTITSLATAPVETADPAVINKIRTYWKEAMGAPLLG